MLEKAHWYEFLSSNNSFANGGDEICVSDPKLLVEDS